MSGDGFTAGVATGVGGVLLFRKVRQFRRRAVNPDMDDPAPSFRLRWLVALVVVALLLVVLAVIVAPAWEGLGLFLSIALVVGAVVGLAVGFVAIWVSAEQRRHVTGYVICEAQYLDAPRKIKASMRRIYRSAASVRSGEAYRAGMFKDLEIDRLVFGAAEHALVSAELATAIRGLSDNARSQDGAALATAKAKLQEIQDQLLDVENSLTRGSKTAEQLSRRLAEPDQSRAREQAAERRAAEEAASREFARARLDDVVVRAAGMESKIDAAAVEEKIEATHLGYEEVVTLSAGLIGTPAARSTAPTPGSAPKFGKEDVAKVAQASGVQARKLSAAAAKWGSNRVRSQKPNGESNP